MMRRRHENKASTTTTQPPKKVCIVGGGPAGALCAKALAERGHAVTLCEVYPHPSQTLRGNKAYCIVISGRGQRALQHVGVSPKDVTGAVLSHVVVRHTARGCKTVAHAEHPSLAASRKSLAAYLLEQAEAAGAQVKLETKLVDVDFEKKIASFQSGNKTENIKYDLLLGCDGAKSMVRELLAAKASDEFQFKVTHDTTEYQVVILPKPFAEIAQNQDDASLPAEAVHSWNHRPTNSLCLGFPHEEGGMLLTIIYPGGKFAEFKQNNSYPEAIAALLSDITDEARGQVIRQLNEGEPSIGGTCVWPSFLGHASYGVALVGDAGNGMYPSLGQGANCALESAAVFVQTMDENDDELNTTTWAERVVTNFHNRRYPDAMAAVNLTYGGYGGNKKRHLNNAPVLFMAQVATMMLLNKVTLGLVPKPAMFRLMLGEDESYSSLKRHIDVYEKIVLFGTITLPFALYAGFKLVRK